MPSWLLLSSLCLLVKAGIEVPRDSCRWLTATEWHTQLKCDGNEVAVGACSGGENKDCPGSAGHQLMCCAVPGYYYSDCAAFAAGHGEPLDCRDHGDGLLLEGSCASGGHHDCSDSSSVTVECCNGHLEGALVGPTDQCTWEYSGHGVQLLCGRSDEVVAGRCGSGKNHDCPGETSHGNLCCELDLITEL